VKKPQTNDLPRTRYSTSTASLSPPRRRPSRSRTAGSPTATPPSRPARAYGGEVFRWDDHAARLADTCETLGLDHGLSEIDLKVPDRRDARRQRPHGRLRETLYHAWGPARHARPQPEVDPTVVVIAKPLARGGVDSTRSTTAPPRSTTKTRKPSSRALPRRREDAQLPQRNLSAAGTARDRCRRGADARSGRQRRRGATANVFFADGTALKTPSLDGPILPRA